LSLILQDTLAESKMPHDVVFSLLTPYKTAVISHVNSCRD